MEEKREKGFREIDDLALEAAAGGWAGSDKYNKGEYNEAGITWDHKIFGKDEYLYEGNSITQSDAEAITTAYKKYGMRAKPR